MSTQEEFEQKLLGWMEEALELRHGAGEDPKGKVSLPPYELGQPAALEMLQRVRVRLDRVEELQSRARQLKGRAYRLRSTSEFDASLAYDTAMHHNRATLSQDYKSADEKKADAALASLNQKRELHQRKQVESLATETLDVISHCYWGLEKLREDLLQMLRIHSFVTSQEIQT